MIVLVANLGSTTFKYRLLDMADSERVIAVGAADRIGQGRSSWSAKAGDQADEGEADLADHAQAIDLHLDALLRLGALKSLDELDAIGFKAVHGGPISGAAVVDDEVLATMRRFEDAAPAHNPVYIAAMEAFREKLPALPQVAAFETGFHQTIPEPRQVYAIPYEWTQEHGIRRYGFHGASHGYIAARMQEMAPEAKRVINFHLGGSSSACAIKDGRSVATSMGYTPQTGLFHNNRVGDFDAFAFTRLTRTGLDLDTILRRLSREGGFSGISGVSGDLRDVEAAAQQGNHRARLAIDVFIESCRHYLGAYLVALGGVDAVTFTGGIGQHSAHVRTEVCRGLDWAGIHIDEAKNQAATGVDENRIDTGALAAQVWVLPTNEELIVARQTVEALTQTGKGV